MNESHKTVEVIDADKLFADIQNIREFAVTSVERNNIWIDVTSSWIKSFRDKLHERYGKDTRFHQQVPSYQMLVGGSVEEEVDITDEAQDFILKEVAVAYKQFKRKVESV